MNRTFCATRGITQSLLPLVCALFALGCVTVESLDEDGVGGSTATGGSTGGGSGGYTGGYTSGGTGGYTGGHTGGGTGGSTGGGSGGTGGGSGGTGGGSSGEAGSSTGGEAGDDTGGSAGAAGGWIPTTGGTSGSGGDTGGGTGGTGGSSGSAGAAGAPPYVGLSVHYQVEHSAPANTAIGSQLWVYNDGDDTVPLSELTLRYYLTNEVTAAPASNINWGNLAPVSGGAADQIPGEITISVVAMPSPTGLADSYVEFVFSGSARSLQPGYRVQFSWTVQNSASQQFNQTNDYSFDAGATSETEWDKVVLLQSGSAVWGRVP